MRLLGPVGPNHGGASSVTEPQPPQSQKCGYGPEETKEIPDLYFSNQTRFYLKSINGI